MSPIKGRECKWQFAVIRKDCCARSIAISFSLSLLRLNLYMRRHVRRRRILLGLSNVDSSDCGMEWRRRRRGKDGMREHAHMGGSPLFPRRRHECGLTNEPLISPPRHGGGGEGERVSAPCYHSHEKFGLPKLGLPFKELARRKKSRTFSQ